MKINNNIKPEDLLGSIENVFDLSGKKILNLEKSWKPENGTPVFTVKGKYSTRGWTEWTQGFQFGSSILQFDATGDESFLQIGRKKTVEMMASHLSHIGVHDHGFNNVSTYGNLLRLMKEGTIPRNDTEQNFYELALKISGAVQAARWTNLEPEGRGYIYSFNGPHSLFIDTIRSLRSLCVSHRLGHALMGEHDERISLLERAVFHADVTAQYSVYYGEGRDAYDVVGRTAHECIFNINDGFFRCPNSQQGYSPFTTWTRGLAWALCGFSELLEFFENISDEEISQTIDAGQFRASLLRAAWATADFYINHTFEDGIPLWDTGAPQVHQLGDYAERRSDPFNKFEPVDSSAAAIAAQGLIRLGNYYQSKKDTKNGKRYKQAGLTVAETLFAEPYLSTDIKHQGLLLHSIYHRPNGWDYVARGQTVPNGESSMWGDYHLRELALLIQRIAGKKPYLTFFRCSED